MMTVIIENRDCLNSVCCGRSCPTENGLKRFNSATYIDYRGFFKRCKSSIRPLFVRSHINIYEFSVNATITGTGLSLVLVGNRLICNCSFNRGKTLHDAVIVPSLLALAPSLLWILATAVNNFSHCC